MTSSTQAQQIDTGSIWKIGLLAIVASVIANLLALAILSAILSLPANFPPLQAGAVGFLTALFTFFAVVIFAIVARTAKTPIKTYRIIATVVFVISIIPNIISAINLSAIPFPFPGATSQAFLVLIVFHLIAYVITVWILTTKTLKS